MYPSLGERVLESVMYPSLEESVGISDVSQSGGIVVLGFNLQLPVPLNCTSPTHQSRHERASTTA